MHRLAIIIGVLLAAGCGERKVSSSDAAATPPVQDGRVPIPDLPGGLKFDSGFSPPSARDVDLLFVIDNSGSTAGWQINLINSFSRLIDGLRSSKLGPDHRSGRICSDQDRSGCQIPNLHIGVVSSDLGAGNYTTLPSCETVGGDGGRLQSKPRRAGCQPPAKPFISYIVADTGEPMTNIPGGGADPIADVVDAFRCIAALGSSGCGFENQLEAMRRALDPQLNVNPEFVRPDALLAVVFLTDEDDCSAKNTLLYDPTQSAVTDPLGPLSSFRCFEFGVQCDINDRFQVGPRHNCVPAGDWLWDIKTRYVELLQRLKPPGRVVIHAIAGPTDRVEVGKDGNNPALLESCQSADGFAVPAIRIKALSEMVPGSQFSSICEADYGPALERLGATILKQLGR